MKAVESRAEVYLMALQSLSKAEREVVIARLLEDTKLMEDILDLAIIRKRQGEPARPFREYLAKRVKYEVKIVRSADKEMDKPPKTIHERVSKRILSLEDNLRPAGIKKLSGREEYRLRVGDYRVLHTLDDRNKLVTISAVGHRLEVYN